MVALTASAGLVGALSASAGHLAHVPLHAQPSEPRVGKHGGRAQDPRSAPLVWGTGERKVDHPTWKPCRPKCGDANCIRGRRSRLTVFRRSVDKSANSSTARYLPSCRGSYIQQSQQSTLAAYWFRALVGWAGSCIFGKHYACQVG